LNEYNPYAPPVDSDPAPHSVEADPPARLLARWGVWLFSGTVFGLILQIAFMVRGYRQIGSASALANNISYAFWSSMLGGLVGLVGAVLICAALRCGNREVWVRKTTMGLSVVSCFVFFPFGILIGLVVGLVAYRSTK